MSAATARRNYGSGGTSTQTMTAPHSHHHSQQQQNNNPGQLYPTSLSSSTSGAAAAAAVAHRSSASNIAAQSRSSAAYGGGGSSYTNGIQQKNAGESWSIQKEGDRQVIVIEDTPPPTATASNSQLPSKASSSSTTAVGSKKQRTTGAGSVAALPHPSSSYQNRHDYQRYDLNNYNHPGPSSIKPATTAVSNNSAAYGASAYPTPAATAPTTTKASGKRKYNEVNDPSAANDRYNVKNALPVDDKDGHYIIRPDDELGETRRYKIIRLLGQGTFGKVVEAWDRDMRTTVAVKIIRAIQKYRDASKVEIKVLNLLRERDTQNVNKCIHLLDCFDHKNHICIVTKLLSCSVFDFLKDNNYLSFPMAHIQSFARQLLLSVAFLHDLRLVHTDLKPENILLVNNEYGSIPIKPPKSNPGLKAKRILKDPSVHLIDFGSATFEDEYHASVVSTRHYRAPEIILGLGWSYPCDVWSIGCILVEFYTGEALFQTHENLEHLAMMEVVFGQMPSNHFGKNGIRNKPEWFAGPSSTKINYPLPTTSKQSKKYVKAMKPLETIIPPVNIVNSRFLDLLNHLLKWDPAERYTVKEALRHPFFSLNINDEEVKQAIGSSR